MQYVNLLGAHGNQADFDSFAREFFLVIGVSEYGERESSNFVDGRYFKGTNNNLDFTISRSDEEEHADLPYWVQIAADMLTAEALVEVVDSIIRNKTVPAGFHFARMVNFGRRDEQRIDY